MSETKTMHYELVNLTNIKCIWTGRQVRSPTTYYNYTQETRALVLEYLFQLIKHIHINGYVMTHILDYLLPPVYQANPNQKQYFDYSSFLGNLIKINNAQIFNKEKNLLIEPKTRSGRSLKTPERYESRVYLKGSGIGGCDQFDRGFAGKDHGDYGAKLWEKESKTATYQKNSFVVDDSVVETDENKFDDSDNNSDNESETWSDYSETDVESDLDEWD